MTSLAHLPGWYAILAFLIRELPATGKNLWGSHRDYEFELNRKNDSHQGSDLEAT